MKNRSTEQLISAVSYKARMGKYVVRKASVIWKRSCCSKAAGTFCPMVPFVQCTTRACPIHPDHLWRSDERPWMRPYIACENENLCLKTKTLKTKTWTPTIFLSPLPGFLASPGFDPALVGKRGNSGCPGFSLCQLSDEIGSFALTIKGLQ